MSLCIRCTNAHRHARKVARLRSVILNVTCNVGSPLTDVLVSALIEARQEESMTDWCVTLRTFGGDGVCFSFLMHVCGRLQEEWESSYSAICSSFLCLIGYCVDVRER